MPSPVILCGEILEYSKLMANGGDGCYPRGLLGKALTAGVLAALAAVCFTIGCRTAGPDPKHVTNNETSVRRVQLLANKFEIKKYRTHLHSPVLLI